MRTRFTEMLGCEHPLQQAAMGGMATPDLAIAVARAGGVGMLSGMLGADMLAPQLAAVPDDLVVGVNFLVPFADHAAVEVAAASSRFVELFWGTPDAALVERARAGGARVGWQIGSPDEARGAVDAGCDVVIAQGVEAGGHVRGEIGLLPLLDEVRDLVDGPLVAAGGIGTGRAMASALVAGADAVRVGTRFLAADESVAHPDYVDALVAANADDTLLTTAFGDGWPDAPHRVLRSAVKAGERRGREQSWSPVWPVAGTVGPVDAHALYAGQSVGAVHGRQPAAEIVDELVAEAARALAG